MRRSGVCAPTMRRPSRRDWPALRERMAANPLARWRPVVTVWARMCYAGFAHNNRTGGATGVMADASWLWLQSHRAQAQEGVLSTATRGPLAFCYELLRNPLTGIRTCVLIS